MQNRFSQTLAGLGICLILFTGTASAQWVTESYPLSAGWNAIWLSHNPSHTDNSDPESGAQIDDLLAGFPQIDEIWRWNPVATTAQFTQAPDLPEEGDTEWKVWFKDNVRTDTMATFRGNAAYLVRTSAATTLTLTGRPVPPSYSWSSSGLNFFGFPLETPANPTDRNFERFLSHTDALSAGPDIFFYNGGDLASNPVRVTTPRTTAAVRGQAYWIRSSQFSDFYGPLRLNVQSSGLSFGDTGTTLSIKVKNVTPYPVDATLTPVRSANAPSGPSVPQDVGLNNEFVPLRMRTGIDPQTGQFMYADLTGPTSVALAAGEEKQLVFAVDRVAMGGSPGDVFQSILQITDTVDEDGTDYSVTRIDVPVSAETTSPNGLWIGVALITTVDQVTSAPVEGADGLATTENTTEADGDTPTAFPIRLILHQSAAGTKLLQQVYVGEDGAGAPIVATAEGSLNPSTLAKARRLSSASFPLDQTVDNTGDMLGLGGTAAFEFLLPFDAPTNPFLHTYHPNHDNKDAQFQPYTRLNDGVDKESFDVTRAMSLNFQPSPPAGVTNLGWGSTVLGGSYEEIYTGLRAVPVTVKGTFILQRVSDIPTLTE